MELDLAKIKTDGQQYVDSVVAQMKEDAWLALKAAKFQNSNADEIELMRVIWYHGFTKGAEAATEISMALHEAIKKQ